MGIQKQCIRTQKRNHNIRQESADGFRQNYHHHIVQK
jgi:hypothetical protein